MKRIIWFRRAQLPLPHERKGSTIVVVIALLLALTFLGLVGYTIGTQEQGNAEYFADAGGRASAGLSRDTLFDWGLRQVILGTRLNERQSALHGGHMSLMATMLGEDLAPYTGQGINVGMGGTSPFNPFVDQDLDGAADAGAGALLEMNRAPFSQGSSGSIGATDQSNYPSPDVDYTYWDINSPFLAYVNKAHVVNTSGDARRMVLPSYHRPQYLRNNGAGVPGNQWYTSPNTQRMVLRPHREHRAIAADGTVTDVRRFIRAGEVAALSSLGITGPFPFDVNDGLWSGDSTVAGGGTNPNSFAGEAFYDADPDNDGINEAVWLDLDYPVQIRENEDGTVSRFVPMFGITIYDADALFNLNAHGNLAGRGNINGTNFGPTTTSPFAGAGGHGFVSESNEALSVSEVNPQYGLTASSGDTTQHSRFYGRAPATSMELANMEWWWLLSGRAERDSSSMVQELYPGRYGEVDDLSAAVSGTLNVNNFPTAGTSFIGDPTAFNLTDYSHLLTDDNLTANEGGQFSDVAALGTGPFINVLNRVFPSSLVLPAWQHPLDLHATGRKTIPGLATTSQDYGKSRYRVQPAGLLYNWPAYSNYDTPPTIGLRNSTYANDLMPGTNTLYNVDDPAEMILEPSLARSDVDSVFGAGENASLHLSNADQDVLGLTGRVRNLAPINFNDDGNIEATEDRRRRYTTTSWDFKTFARMVTGTPATDKFREWELTNGGTHFRTAVRELLRMNPGNTALSNTALQRKLSLNHILDYDPFGRLRFRPLTPHPAGLGSEPVQNTNTMGANYTTKPGSPDELVGSTGTPRTLTLADQEWLARYDRQRLCRDIYMMLYILGGGRDNVNYGTNAAAYVDYNSDGIFEDPRLMAQFAVNLVDQMDSDNISTVFEYDQNLTNGWGLNDDPFDETAAEAALPVNERQIVFGIEEQSLTLSEAQLLIATRVLDAAGTAGENHKATEYEDDENRDWSFIELENVSPNTVQDFGNGNWQIVIEENTASPTASFGVRKRWLTLLGNLGNVTPGNRYTIGTTGDEDNYGASMGTQTPAGMGAMLVPSHFRVDPNYDSTSMTGAFDNAGFQGNQNAFQLAPRGNLSLDLIQTANVNLFSVFPKTDAVSGSASDGDLPGAVGDGFDFFGHTGDDYDPTQDALDSTTTADLPTVKLTLRRRVNPTRVGPSSPTAIAEAADNPWIEVDSINITPDLFKLVRDDESTEIQPKLNLPSTERDEPLDGTVQTAAPGVPANFKYNSLGLRNDRSNLIAGGQFALYQQHFNRPFSSPVELLSVPLYGPNDHVPANLKFENSNAPATIDPMTNVVNYRMAFQKFLTPDFPDAQDPNADRDNRWYRLLGFVEVPDRSHRHPASSNTAANTLVRSPFIIDVGNTGDVGTFYRRPGRVQLNTMRNPEVLAGLLDDPEVVRLSTTTPLPLAPMTGVPTGSNNDFLFDQNSGNPSGAAAGRDWWIKFVQARDGSDPQTGEFLPGLPTARPFRSFSYSANGTASMEDTLLRRLPGGTGRLLFELGSDTAHTTGTIDHSMRHRMLAKVLNNSTNRSNVFLIFMQVDFFEAAEVTATVGMNTYQVVRVGAKTAESPSYRGFFVVDRSKIYEVLSDLVADDPAYNAATQFLPATFTDPVDSATKFNFSFNQDFDYHSLILHRQTIN